MVQDSGKQEIPAGSSGGGKFRHFRQDFLASIVVFLVALPLCIGIAVAVGVNPARALLTGIIGGIVVGFFCRFALASQWAGGGTVCHCGGPVGKRPRKLPGEGWRGRSNTKEPAGN